MKGTSYPDILFLATSFPPEQVGGVEQHTLELARTFKMLGLETVFYVRGQRDDLDEYTTYRVDYEGFQVTRVIYRWQKARSVRHIYDDDALVSVFARFLDRTKPRLVHVHHLSGIGVSCLKVVKDSGIPLVMTLHDYWMMCPRGQMFHADLYPCETIDARLCTPCIKATWPGLMPSGGGIPFEATLPKEDLPTVDALHSWLLKALSIPDVLLTPSSSAKKRFVAFGVPEERIVVEENGIDTKPFENIKRTKSDRIRFGFIGTIFPSKGTHILLEAFSRLPEGKATLTIAGNAPPYHQYTTYMDRITELAEKAKGNNPVEIIGTYKHEDLPRLLSNIDVVVVPPIWNEVFGLTLREALAAGCAVVASNVGGLPEAVIDGENGFIFPPGDVNALHGILMKFIKDPSLAQRLGKGPKKIRTIQEMSTSLLKTYKKLGL